MQYCISICFDIEEIGCFFIQILLKIKVVLLIDGKLYINIYIVIWLIKVIQKIVYLNDYFFFLDKMYIMYIDNMGLINII